MTDAYRQDGLAMADENADLKRRLDEAVRKLRRNASRRRCAAIILAGFLLAFGVITFLISRHFEQTEPDDWGRRASPHQHLTAVSIVEACCLPFAIAVYAGVALDERRAEGEERRRLERSAPHRRRTRSTGPR